MPKIANRQPVVSRKICMCCLRCLVVVAAVPPTRNWPNRPGSQFLRYGALKRARLFHA